MDMSARSLRTRTNALDDHRRLVPHALPWESIRSCRSRRISILRGSFDDDASDEFDSEEDYEEEDYEEELIEDADELEEEVEEVEDSESDALDSEEISFGGTWVEIDAKIFQAMLDGDIKSDADDDLDLSAAVDFLYMKWIEEHLPEMRGLEGRMCLRQVLRRIPKNVDARRGVANLQRNDDGSIVLTRTGLEVDDDTRTSTTMRDHEREGIVRIYSDDPWTERVKEFPCTCLASTGQDRWRIDAEHASRFVDACSEGEVSDVMIELAVSECAADTNQSVWLVGTSSETARGLWPLPAGVADEPARDWMNSCLSISVDDAFVAREIQEVVDRYEKRARAFRSSNVPLIDAAGAWTLLCGNS